MHCVQSIYQTAVCVANHCTLAVFRKFADKMFKLFDPIIKIVRVYGEVQESVDYPIPRDLTTPNTLSGTGRDIGEELRKAIALHHLIRVSGKPYNLPLDVLWKILVKYYGICRNINLQLYAITGFSLTFCTIIWWLMVL